MFYAAINSYATETSIGFSNTWGVIGFATRAMRDAYVKRATDLATKAISASKVRTYGGKKGQISHYDASGEYQECIPAGMYDRSPRFHSTGEKINSVTAAPELCAAYLRVEAL